MDRVTDFESGGWGFDSLWGRWKFGGRVFSVLFLSMRNVIIQFEYAMKLGVS